MPGIVELSGAETLPRAIREGFDADMVVVTGLVNEEFAEKYAARLAPHQKKTKSVLALKGANRGIGSLREARQEMQSCVRERLDLSLIFPTRYNLKPDLLRRGSIKRHIDNPQILASLSINLNCEEDAVPVFAAERIAPVDAPTSEIRTIHEERYDSDGELSSQVELCVGDAVFITRGVEHEVTSAGAGRVAMILSTRHIFLP